jgi:hypothetical protein
MKIKQLFETTDEDGVKNLLGMKIQGHIVTVDTPTFLGKPINVCNLLSVQITSICTEAGAYLKVLIIPSCFLTIKLVSGQTSGG